MQRRFFFFDHGKYGMGDESVPEIGDTQILIKSTRSLVCVGTETACNTGKCRWNVGRHGYSNVGRVVQAGKAVKGFSSSTRVVCTGTHSEYNVIDTSNFSVCSVIPDEVSDEEASFTVLGNVAMHALERAELTAGCPVVVVGQGTIGQMAQQLARMCGAGRVIAVETDKVRRDLALALGADDAIAPDEQELKAALGRTCAGACAPVFIDLTGSAAAAAWIFNVAPLRSRIVLAGNYVQPLTVDPLAIVERELDVAGAHQPKCPQQPSLFHAYSRTFNTGFVMEQLQRKRLRVRELCDGVIAPEELLAFYDAVRDRKPHLRQPILKWE